jgi:hypothetical protein
MLSLDSTALNAASPATAAAKIASPASQAQSASLIGAIVRAMSAGDSSAISVGLSQLASISTSAAGANVLQQLSGSFASSASSSSSPVSLLLQGLNSSSSSSTNLLV